MIGLRIGIPGFLLATPQTGSVATSLDASLSRAAFTSTRMGQKASLL